MNLTRQYIEKKEHIPKPEYKHYRFASMRSYVREYCKICDTLMIPMFENNYVLVATNAEYDTYVCKFLYGVTMLSRGLIDGILLEERYEFD